MGDISRYKGGAMAKGRSRKAPSRSRSMRKQDGDDVVAVNNVNFDDPGASLSSRSGSDDLTVQAPQMDIPPEAPPNPSLRDRADAAVERFRRRRPIVSTVLGAAAELSDGELNVEGKF